MTSIKVPPLGESIVEATIGRWLVEEGGSVAQGDPIVELETDKINVEVPAPSAGVVSKHLVQPGDVVKVDQALAELDESAQPSATGAKPADEDAAAPAKAAAASDSGNGGGGSGKTSPSVRRIAAEEGVDPAGVQGSGPGGRVTKGDMLQAVEQKGDRPAAAAASTATAAPATPTPPAAKPKSAPAPFPTPASGGAKRSADDGPRETREKMTTRRRRIAEHLLEAQHATASLTTFNEVDMTAVMAVRERLRDRTEKEHGVKLTFMPFFIKSAVMALKSYPMVNAKVDGDSIIYNHYVNMGIAVASDAGLVVPVIKDADRKGMLDVSRDISDLAKRARDGKLTMDDLTGGTFTVTNGGVFGSLVSTPILNYPQVGILGLHKIQERPVAVNGAVEIRPMMYIALTYDHRIIDGQQAVLFLVRIKELMEDPAAMLVE